MHGRISMVTIRNSSQIMYTCSNSAKLSQVSIILAPNMELIMQMLRDLQNLPRPRLPSKSVRESTYEYDKTYRVVSSQILGCHHLLLFFLISVVNAGILNIFDAFIEGRLALMVCPGFSVLHMLFLELFGSLLSQDILIILRS